jgi:hypothetical protein
LAKENIYNPPLTKGTVVTMADIFISYTNEDLSRVEPLVKALQDKGWTVFWDRMIPPGKTWRQVIAEALESARSVIVAWSKTSVDSRWVQEEADRGLERNILIPILIDRVRPPLGFTMIQSADLTHWEPTRPSPEFSKLIADLSSILGPSPIEVKDAKQKLAEDEQILLQERARIEEVRKVEELNKLSEAEGAYLKVDLERQRLEKIVKRLADEKRKLEEEHKRIEAALETEKSRKQNEVEIETKQVFICHDKKDAKLAHKLAEDLNRLGVKVWISPESIDPGESWVDAINRGLEESSHMVVLLTPAAVKSKWVKMETNVAISLEIDDLIQVIPLDVEPCKTPPLWNSYQMISFRQDYETGLDQLSASLKLRKTLGE